MSPRARILVVVGAVAALAVGATVALVAYWQGDALGRFRLSCSG